MKTIFLAADAFLWASRSKMSRPLLSWPAAVAAKNVATPARAARRLRFRKIDASMVTPFREDRNAKRLAGARRGFWPHAKRERSERQSTSPRRQRRESVG